ncbi:MAG: hypothetical protein COX77_03155 [Candidatus Komeilibacteria bacterium CG_4_10_14_0_2_um_filter_37_10]|uniref:DUF721 domain-containing protein n=1 Tax=Candidatus Komeilibacteria bacterium CG_4_10_14_0_2_um_filter_37_10 TaxID=1974470 RepID=A0A2M7VET5_9BACT|nr:MAG: hypothetical protein COX77_03155 [Candidatus Komeilibacteria bacterium CG_4_10_14_0_2_um_filter_37_10]PJA92719.1 MAG: hypothetical protein CO133_01675 [Candidatus Komeilibacteria bacterium CG_4_9_14_3_um_filter_37_5]
MTFNTLSSLLNQKSSSNRYGQQIETATVLAYAQRLLNEQYVIDSGTEMTAVSIKSGVIKIKVNSSLLGTYIKLRGEMLKRKINDHFQKEVVQSVLVTLN